jgi:hypothetical protein
MANSKIAYHYVFKESYTQSGTIPDMLSAHGEIIRE